MAMPKPKFQILRWWGAYVIKNTAKTYVVERMKYKECRRKKKIIIADFLVGSKYGKWCKFIKMLWYKISENPQKSVFTIAGSGDEQN